MRAAEACVTQARGFRPDVLVAVGGGSNMDLAKISAVLLAHGGHPRDYVGDGKVPVIRWRGHGGGAHSIRWNGREFR